MRSILLATLFVLGACAPEVPRVAETSGGEVEAAGAKAEALATSTEVAQVVPTPCLALASFGRTWFDNNTPGSLVCSDPSSADTWNCHTNSPPITYQVRRRTAIYSGNTCSSIQWSVTQSQASTWGFICTFNGVTSSCHD